MKLSEIEKQIEPIIEDLGYFLFDVEKVTENKSKILRVTIDKKEGININDCEKVNNAIEPIIFKDEQNDIEYFEVSSPGVEKHLKKDRQILSNLGADVKVTLYKKLDRQKEIQGKLKDLKDKKLIVEINKKDIAIDMSSIASITTIYDFSKDFGGNNESNR